MNSQAIAAPTAIGVTELGTPSSFAVVRAAEKFRALPTAAVPSTAARMNAQIAARLAMSAAARSSGRVPVASLALRARF